MTSLAKTLEAVLEHDLAGDVGKRIEERLAALTRPDQKDQPDWQDIWRASFEDFHLPYVEELALAHLQKFLAESAVYEFVPALLEELKFQNIKVGLLSNATGPADLFRKDFEERGLSDQFDAAVWSCEIGVRKPHRLAFEAVAEGLAMHPSELVMIGDSEVVDIQGAKALGMRTVRVYSSGALPDSQADLITRNRDLPTLLRGPRHAMLSRLAGY